MEAPFVISSSSRLLSNIINVTLKDENIEDMHIKCYFCNTLLQNNSEKKKKKELRLNIVIWGTYYTVTYGYKNQLLYTYI